MDSGKPNAVSTGSGPDFLEWHADPEETAKPRSSKSCTRLEAGRDGRLNEKIAE